MTDAVQPPSPFHLEKILSVKHWTDRLFSFTATRPQSFRFRSGEFVMIGLPTTDGSKPVMRAYSIASPSWDDTLEFLSIKVQDGPLTARLQKIQPGDPLLLGKKATGTLVNAALLPGKRLYLLGTGTGLAPWLSVARDPETYERFEQVVICHSVRQVEELCYRELLTKDIFEHEILSDLVANGKLVYYPTVTREAFERTGRLTDHIKSSALFKDLGLDQTAFNPETDRIMVCGSVAMNADMQAICKNQGLIEGAVSKPGAFVVERAFVGEWIASLDKLLPDQSFS